MEALLQLVTHDRLKYVRLAARQLHSEDDAEDVVQNATIMALRNIDQFEGRSKLGTWFSRIVLNCVKMHMRRRGLSRRFSFVGMEEPINGRFKVEDILPDPRPVLIEEKCQFEEKTRRLFEAVQLLSINERTAILLYLEGLTYREIAEVLGSPVGTIKARMSRAKERLAKYMLGKTGRRLYAIQPTGGDRMKREMYGIPV